MLQACGMLLACVALTMAALARGKNRTRRMLVWAIYAEIVWFWVFFARLAITAFAGIEATP